MRLRIACPAGMSRKSSAPHICTGGSQPDCDLSFCHLGRDLAANRGMLPCTQDTNAWTVEVWTKMHKTTDFASLDSEYASIWGESRDAEYGDFKPSFLSHLERLNELKTGSGGIPIGVSDAAHSEVALAVNTNTGSPVGTLGLFTGLGLAGTCAAGFHPATKPGTTDTYVSLVDDDRAGSWVHLAVVQRPEILPKGRIDMYLDGVLAGSVDCSLSYLLVSGPSGHGWAEREVSHLAKGRTDL